MGGTSLFSPTLGEFCIRSWAPRPTPGSRPVIVLDKHIRSVDGELVALGLWKLIFDHEHSDTELVGCILHENRCVHASVRGTQTSAIQRKATLAREAKVLSSLRDLRTHAGLAYKDVCTVSDLLSLVNQLSGSESAGERRACFRAEELPSDTLLTPLCSHTRLGGTHVLSPEYCWNAKRAAALSTGLISPNTGMPLPVAESAGHTEAGVRRSRKGTKRCTNILSHIYIYIIYIYVIAC